MFVEPRKEALPSEVETIAQLLHKIGDIVSEKPEFNKKTGALERAVLIDKNGRKIEITYDTKENPRTFKVIDPSGNAEIFDDLAALSRDQYTIIKGKLFGHPAIEGYRKTKRAVDNHVQYDELTHLGREPRSH